MALNKIYIYITIEVQSVTYPFSISKKTRADLYEHCSNMTMLLCKRDRETLE